MNKMARRLKMLGAGLNIPDYVENPVTKGGGKKTYRAFLRQVFYGYQNVVVMTGEVDGLLEIELVAQKLSNVYDVIEFYEKQGKCVWVIEDIEVEKSGLVHVKRDGSGMLYGASYFPALEFKNLETIQPIRDRSVTRRVYEFLTKHLNTESVSVEFVWATTFCGKLDEKIVFFDYLPL